MFHKLILDNSSVESKLFVKHLTVSKSEILEIFDHSKIFPLVFELNNIIFQDSFQSHFPGKLLPHYFKPCEIGFAAPKSLGVATPIVHNCDDNNGEAAYAPLRLHSNWTVTPGLEFSIGKLTLSEYIHFLRKS